MNEVAYIFITVIALLTGLAVTVLLAVNSNDHKREDFRVSCAELHGTAYIGDDKLCVSSDGRVLKWDH